MVEGWGVGRRPVDVLACEVREVGSSSMADGTLVSDGTTGYDDVGEVIGSLQRCVGWSRDSVEYETTLKVVKAVIAEMFTVPCSLMRIHNTAVYRVCVERGQRLTTLSIDGKRSKV